MKNLYIVALLSLTLLTTTLYNKDEQVDEYEQWKLKYRKLYQGVEDSYRKQIFHQNLLLVNEHNSKYEQGLESFTIETNQFADLTFEEFSSLYLYSSHPDQGSINKINNVNINKSFNKVDATPDNHDWVSLVGEAKYPVYDQGRCLGSWAFAVAGSIEISVYDGAYIQRSPQHLINCVNQTNPCLGGNVTATWEWAKLNELDPEVNVTYTGIKSDCTAPVDGVQVTDTVVITQFDTHEDYYKNLVENAVVSPISVNNILFQLYKNGVYDKNCGVNNNYDALVVGYDARTDQGYKPFYKLKMSWSKQYGENGYIRIAMDNQCVTSKQSFAVKVVP